jgi:hypothetical protein
MSAGFILKPTKGFLDVSSAPDLASWVAGDELQHCTRLPQDLLPYAANKTQFSAYLCTMTRL